MTPTTSHTCVTADKGVTFCYPTDKKQKGFYIAVDPSVHSAKPSEARDLQGLLNGKRPPVPTTQIPDALSSYSDWRVYDITGTLPDNIPANLWKGGPWPGPNCYQAALCASGFDYLCDRYVDTSEAEFLLGLFYQKTNPNFCGTRPGTIAVFHSPSIVKMGIQMYQASPDWLEDPYQIQEIKDQERAHGTTIYNFDSPLQIKATLNPFGIFPYADAGVHMAYSLLGGLVFHKLSFYIGAGNRIDPIDKATQKMDEDAARRITDPYERSWTLKRDYQYKMTCYQPKMGATVPISKVDWPAEERTYYLSLLKFYSALITDVAQKTNSGKDFDQHRTSLLTVENVWKFLREFRKKVGSNLKEELAKDPELAIAYFTADSLSWQYRAMSDRFYPISQRSQRRAEQQLKEMYEKYYLRPSPLFVKEIYAHLSAKRIPREKWEGIAKAVITELTSVDARGVKKYDPMKYYKSNGSKGAPFFDILEQAIKSSM